MELIRHPANPVIPVTPWTWRDREAGSPRALIADGRIRVYLRGQMGSHDRIGAVSAPAADFNPARLRDEATNPVLDVGAPGSFGDLALGWPSVLHHSGAWTMWYSARSGKGVPGIGAAVSMDGLSWQKVPGGPLIAGDEPCVVSDSAGLLHLFFSRPGGDGRGAIWRATSRDGLKWEPSAAPCLACADFGAWSYAGCTAPCVFGGPETWWMLFAAADIDSACPRGMGLAASADLRSWQPITDSPVMVAGERTAWDGGAVWPGSVVEVGGRRWLFYEGCGVGYRGAEKGPPILQPCQVGAAEIPGELPRP
jgi:predicted GH43/DUF377 family glycosyl hydrolase